jgi:hypothetical protein
MIYKLKFKHPITTNFKEIIVEDNKEPNERVNFPKGITKFRLLLFLFNPYVEVQRYVNYKWDSIFYWPYRKLYFGGLYNETLC